MNHSTTRATILPEIIRKNAQDCKREWLAAALEDGYEIPEPAPDVKYTNH